MELFTNTDEEKRNLSVRTTLILLGLILLLAVYLRFVGFPNRFGIGGDSARDAFVAAYGASAFQLPLTGPFSSLGAFTFGPWYYWQLIFFSMLTHLPYAPWIYMSLASIGFIFVMYLIGRELYGTAFGIIVAFLTTISPPQISSAKGLTNPNLISLFAGLSFYLFLKILKKDTSPHWYGFLLGLFLGIGVNIHYQMINLLVLIPVLFVFRPKTYIHLLWAGVGFCGACLPMLFFDLTNHWFTVRNMTYLSMHGKEIIYVANSWRIYLFDFWPQSVSYAFGSSKIVTSIIIVFIGAAMAYAAYTKKITRPFFSLIIAFAINFVTLRYYWGERFMGYLQYFYPYLFVFFGYAFFQVYKRSTVLLSVLLLAYVLVALPKITYELKPDEFHTWTKRLANEVIALYPEKKFHVYTCKLHNWDQIQAITYQLALQGRIDDAGMPIAFGKNVCGLPVNAHYDPSSAIPKDVQMKPYYPSFFDSDDAIVLTAASEAAILSSNYRPITPQAIYDTTTKWWYAEKP